MPPVNVTQHAGTFKPMLWLALPVLAEESLNLLVGYTDWWLVGHYLPDPQFKAAMGVMAYLLWFVPSLFSAISIGATALASRYVGASKPEDAAKVANQAIMIGVTFALAATALIFFGAEYFVAGLQLKGEAATHAVRYLRIITPIIPFIMIEQVASACLRGAGDTLSGFLAKIVVNTVNIGVSACLLIGPGSIPSLGWDGVAIGTACGHFVGGSILLALLLRGRAGLQLRFRQMRPDRGIVRPLFRIGFPGGLDTMIILFCHLTFLSLINSLGTAATAAHGLGVQLEALAYLPGSAFSVAAATLTGQYLGAKAPDRAARGVLYALATGGIIMTLAGCVFFFAGNWLTTIFTGDPADPTGNMTAQLLRIGAISMPSLAVISILSGALRGAGDTRGPLMITLTGFFVVRIPLTLALIYPVTFLPTAASQYVDFQLGVRGAWYAMVLDIGLRSVLIGVRFLRGRWRELKVC